MLVQDLIHWPELCCWHSDESGQRKISLPNLQFFGILRTCLLCGQETLGLMSTAPEYYVFCLLNFLHFCPLSFYRIWQGKISVNSTASQSLWRIKLHDQVETGLAGGIDQKECFLFWPVNTVFSKLSTKKYWSTITTRGLTALGVLKYIVLGLWRALLTPSACLPSNLSCTSSKCYTCYLGSQVNSVLNIQTEWKD